MMGSREDSMSSLNLDDPALYLQMGADGQAVSISHRDVQMGMSHHENNPSLSRKELQDQFHSGRQSQHRLSRIALADTMTMSAGLTTAEAGRLLAQHGRNELVEKVKPRWKLLLEQFTGPMPIGIWCAIVVEAILGNVLDVVVLLALQFINGAVGFYERNKADNAVAALKASLKPFAQARRDNVWVKIDAGELVPGDLIMLTSGAAVPADSVVHAGGLSVDQSSLTGESLPVRMERGDQAKMGSTVARGEVEATVYATGMGTMYGQTAALLQSADTGLGDLDKLLLRLVFNLLILSVILCAITLIYLLSAGQNFKEALSFVVVLLVASIPIAIEVVITASLALGSRELSSFNAIVAKLTAIERLAGMNILCSDKTGTLTLNKMAIQQECPLFAAGITRDDVLLHAALATKWNEPAKDALDTMVLAVADIARCNLYEQRDYTPFDSELKRTEALLVDANGVHFRVMKGAPHALLDLCHNKAVIGPAVELATINLASRGIRSLAVARSNADNQMTMMGLLAFLDPARPDAAATIHKANSYGVAVKMITGDHQLVAVEMARQLCLGRGKITPCTTDNLPVLDLQATKGVVPVTLGIEYGDLILETDGFSQALPEHKFVIISALKQRGYIVGMTGDGVNDAPALKVAHIGVAVQGATDAARAAADIVLTAPGLNAIVEAILIARRIFARMNSFLIYRVAATIQLLVFFFIAVLFIHPHTFMPNFPQFWSMPVIALITITVLNDGTIIAIAYDHVATAKKPQVWNMAKLWGLSLVLGAVACISSIIMLFIALNSHSDASIMRWFNLAPLSYGQVVVVLYLKVSLSDFLTIFTSRTGVRTAFSKLPSLTLFGAALFAVATSTAMALMWPWGNASAIDSGEAVSVGAVLFTWLYCLFWFLVQDGFKVIVFRLCHRRSKKRSSKDASARV